MFQLAARHLPRSPRSAVMPFAPRRRLQAKGISVLSICARANFVRAFCPQSICATAIWALIFCAMAGAAGAQPQPQAPSFATKPIRLVVPFPAGGGVDLIARALSEGLARELGQPVVIDNKGGAGTAIGNDIVAKAPADGLTILLNTSAIAILPSLNPKLPYAAETAFAPITLLGRAPIVAVVRAESPLRSGADLLARARAKPGAISYGSAGMGTSTHLSAELVKVTAKVFMVHVPYRGAAPMFTDLLGGQIDVGFATLPSVAAFLSSGKMRALAATSAQRSPLIPEVPTFAEGQLKGYQAEVWYAAFAPAGTPGATVNQWHAAFKRASESEDFRKRAAAEGLLVTLDSPEDTARFVRAEEALWRRVVKEQSIKAE